MEGGPVLSPPAQKSFTRILALYVFEGVGCRRGRALYYVVIPALPRRRLNRVCGWWDKRSSACRGQAPDDRTRQTTEDARRRERPGVVTAPGHRPPARSIPGSIVCLAQHAPQNFGRWLLQQLRAFHNQRPQAIAVTGFLQPRGHRPLQYRGRTEAQLERLRWTAFSTRASA